MVKWTYFYFCFQWQRNARRRNKFITDNKIKNEVENLWTGAEFEKVREFILKSSTTKNNTPYLYLQKKELSHLFL